MAGKNVSGNDVMDVDAPEHVSVEKNVSTFESEEDVIMDWKSSEPDIIPLDDEGSLKAETSDYGASRKDCEAAVIVTSNYAKYGNICYFRCCLFFFPMCVRLEGSIFGDKRKHCVLEWPTSDILKIEYQHEESVEDGFICMQFKSEDKNGDDIKNQTSGFMELEFLVDDRKWLKNQEEIKSLDLKYKSAWRNISSERRFNESCGGIVFPEEDPDSISIRSKDMECLQPRNFINDTIIDFYIKYLVSKINPMEQLRFHFFNTFFFKKLLDVKEGKDSFQSIHKWTRNVNIFEKDYVFIPVNKSLHWSLIVICDPGRISSYDGIDLDASSIPCILHMNSLSGFHNDIENDIKCYLWEEWKQLNGYNEDTYTKFSNLEFKALQSPQQDNYFDCGLFLLHYAELFLDHAPNFDRTRYDDVINEHWFHPAKVTVKKRYQIRKLIQKIGEDSAARHSPDPADNDVCGKSGASYVRSVKEKGSDNSCVATKNISDDDQIKGPQCSLWRESTMESPSARHTLVPTNDDDFLMGISGDSSVRSVVAEGSDHSVIAIKSISDDDDEIKVQRSCMPSKYPDCKQGKHSESPSEVSLLHTKDEDVRQDICSSVGALQRYELDTTPTPLAVVLHHKSPLLVDVQEKGPDDGCIAVENISDDDFDEEANLYDVSC